MRKPFTGDQWTVNSAERLRSLQPYRRVLISIDGSDVPLALLPTIDDALDPAVAEVELVTVIRSTAERNSRDRARTGVDGASW